jgi:hypothetical protein
VSDLLKLGVIRPEDVVIAERPARPHTRGADARTARPATTSYRIGFLNPWSEKAENQAFRSLEIAAERIGHQLVHVTNSDEILAAQLDFVLAIHPLQAKTTDVPTFGVIHSPRALLLEWDYYGQTLLTYDGYLTIMDTIDRFLRGLCAGTRRADKIGFYYNSPQILDFGADLQQLAARDALGLCYFGTNWDPRSRALFKALAKRDYFRAYGPPGAWDYIEGAYKGAAPFDGCAVQQEYARFGVGLVVLSKQHTLDDVISNRLFEIASVGAVAICPDIPWIRKNFGDSVLYYHPHNRTSEIVEEIDLLMAEVKADPAGTALRASRAREIFEERFSAEVLLNKAVEYFEDWRDTTGKPRPPSESPTIDVIVRVGGRPASTVLRAITSIDGQSDGRFRVIFVRYKPVELSSITERAWTRIESFDVVDRFGGDRAATMTAGLAAVRNELFAVLDDDDFWLSDHIRWLRSAAEECAPGRVYAYGGYLTVEEGGAAEAGAAGERRKIGSMAPASGDVASISSGFAPHSWLASSALLRFLPLENWTLATAEDSVLQANLMSRGDCVFTYRATACSVRGSHESSSWATSPTRSEDVFEYYTRVYSSIDRIERKFATPARSSWATLNGALQQVLQEKLEQASVVSVLGDAPAGASIHDLDDNERREVPLSPDRISLWGASRFETHEGEPAVIVAAEAQPWAYGAGVRLEPSELSRDGFVVLELAPTSSPTVVGVLNRAGDDFRWMAELPPSQRSIELWAPTKDPGDVSAVILRNGAEPARSAVTLKKVWLASPSAAPAGR